MQEQFAGQPVSYFLMYSEGFAGVGDGPPTLEDLRTWEEHYAWDDTAVALLDDESVGINALYPHYGGYKGHGVLARGVVFHELFPADAPAAILSALDRPAPE